MKAEATVLEPAGARLETTRIGLAATRANRLLVAGVVLSLFLERFERIEGAETYPLLPIPDLFFVIAISGLAAKTLLDLVRQRPVTCLRSLGRKDLVLCTFVVLLAILSLLAVATQPDSVATATQSTKSFLHLVFLACAALLLGRALSARLVETALNVYFASAVAVAMLSILQALDQNVLHTGLAEGLDLTSRAATDFIRPASIFSEPAYLGYASLGGIVIGVAFVARGWRYLRLAGVCVCVIALLLSSAAGPLALAVPVLAYVVVVHRVHIGRQLLPVIAAVLAVSIVTVVVTSVGRAIVDRAQAVATGDDASAELRKELNKGSIELWKLAPVTGVGLGNSRLNLTRFVDVSRFIGSPPPNVIIPFNSSNAYVNLLGEAGILGAAALPLVLLVLYLRNRGAAAHLEVATQTFIVLMTLQCLVTNPLLLPPLWFWAGLRLALQSPGQ